MLTVAQEEFPESVNAQVVINGATGAYCMPSSAGPRSHTVCPQGEEYGSEAVARAAAFRRRREHDCRDAEGRATQGAVAEGSETP